jgi:hemoglobin
MRKRHYPFTIDEAARDIWLRQLWWAFDDVGFPSQIREEYWNWVEAFSIRMINRRTQRAQPQRYPFREVPTTLLQGYESATTDAPKGVRKYATRDDSVQQAGLRSTGPAAADQFN